MEVPKDVDAGQRDYTKLGLAFYDFYVLNFSNKFVWRCPTDLLLKRFIKYTSLNHLDVGVGTGYFLDKCLSDTQNQRIALLDLNANSLAATANRIARFSPEVYRANVLEPLPLNCEKFDSISLNYLIHCLPGTIPTKAKLFDHLIAYLNPGGVIFGATVLNIGSENGFLAKKLLPLYNKRGMFTNLQDSLSDLKSELENRFNGVEIEVMGSVALFKANL